MLKHFPASKTVSPATRQFLVHLDWTHYVCERMNVILMYIAQSMEQWNHSFT